MGQRVWNTSGGLMRPDFLGMGRQTGGVGGGGELCVISSDSVLPFWKSVSSGTIAATWICACTSGNKAPTCRKINAGCQALLWLAGPVRLSEVFLMSWDHFWELWNWEENLFGFIVSSKIPQDAVVTMTAQEIFASAWLVCWIAMIIKEIKSLAIRTDFLAVLKRAERRFG